jgi:glycosyltransferase involved in cell wall biosynthesis
VLSIVTISYNHDIGLEQTLRSLRPIRDSLEQTEIHVVEGGSTKFTKHDLELIVGSIASFTTEKDRGIADAWNKGISRCTGSQIMILNAGDTLAKGGASRLLDVVATNREGVGVADVTVRHDARRERVRRMPNRYPVWIGTGFLHPGIIVSHSTMALVGPYDVNYAIASDCAWVFRARRLGVEFYRSGVPIDMEPGGVSAVQQASARNEYEAVLGESGFGRSTLLCARAFSKVLAFRSPRSTRG